MRVSHSPGHGVVWSGAATASGSQAPVGAPDDAPDGSRVLLVHASPGSDDGPGLRPEQSDAELAAVGFTGDQADLVFVGTLTTRRAQGQWLPCGQPGASQSAAHPRRSGVVGLYSKRRAPATQWSAEPLLTTSPEWWKT